MEIKLSIKSQALTPRQKGAIVEKLEEIKAIVNNGNSVFTTKNEREDRINKLGVFFDELREKQITSHQQSENGTLPQSDLHDELCNGKRLLIEKEPPLRIQFHGSEKQRATIHSIFQRTQAESNLLEMTLDQMIRSERHRSQQCGMSQVSELERFLLQVDNFQKQVKLQIFPLFENINHNKI